MYEELVDDKWNDWICICSGKYFYNIVLFFLMIVYYGEVDIKVWLEGLKDNFVCKFQGGDWDQIKVIVEGVCDIFIGNSYYYGKMLQDDSQCEIVEQVCLVFLNVEG